MANFNTQLAKCDRIQPNIVSDELFVFIKSLSALMVEMNKKQINEDSQDIYGKAIGFYSAATDYITMGRKAEGDPFTGDNTGDWLKSFYVTVLDDIFYFGASDYKTDIILEDSPRNPWLSKDLFGLSDENLKEVIETRITPFVLNYYRKELGL
jgi:uncharacterized protein (UPF0335 family)